MIPHLLPEFIYKRAIYLCESDSRVFRHCRSTHVLCTDYGRGSILQCRKKRSPDRLQISIMRNLGDNSHTPKATSVPCVYVRRHNCSRGDFAHQFQRDSLRIAGGWDSSIVCTTTVWMTVESPRQPQGPRQGRPSAEKSGRMEQVLTRKSISKDQLRKSNDSTHLRERKKDSMYICVYANSTSRLAVLHNRYYSAFGSFCAWRGFWT